MKTSFLSLALAAAIPLSAFATITVPLEHGCLFKFGEHVFGVTGTSEKTPGHADAVTFVAYGWGQWELRLHFYSVVAGAALLGALGAVGCVFILRRRLHPAV